MTHLRAYITNKEDIETAVKDIVGRYPISTRISPSNKRRIAFIELPEEQAQCLLTREKINIAWAKCKVSEVVTPVKCFKCQMYGHISKACTEKETTNKCLKCCEDGHKAKECVNPRKCHQCKSDGHSVGTMQCPIFRNLVREMKGGSREIERSK